MKVVGLQTQIWSNNLKSTLLLITFPFLILFMVFLIVVALTIWGGSSDMFGDIFSMMLCFTPLTFILVGIWFLIAWAFHKKMIIKMTKSKPVERKENPELYNIVENLAVSRGLSTPRIYIIQDSSMNAFASGLSPNDAMITFTSGLLTKLTPREIQAVAAHEMTHIINRDVRLMVIAIIFVGILQTMANIFVRINVGSRRNRDSGNSGLIIFLIQILIFVIGFLVSVLVQLAISRKREYLADAGAVELTKTSEYLISALEKISQDSTVEAVQNPSIAQMFISNPLQGKGGWFRRLFATHPPMEERIAALRQIG